MPRLLKEDIKTKSVVMQPYNKNLKLPSRDLRSNMTDAEQWLWQRLRR
jgi:very-short-patch-repair endonuclease